ncbi:MAG: hypothetical protein ABI053_02400 [Lacisediminihabitans sp.]
MDGAQLNRAQLDRAQLRVATELAGTVLGCLLVSAALAIIWVARSTVRRDLYVSELGAVGEPTANWFRTALLLIVVGGSLIALAARDIRSAAPILRLWTPSISLWIGCGFFLIASQVTCTAQCPLPVGASFTWQDLAHTIVAVLAFSAACWAMLQTSFLSGHRKLAVSSLACGSLVAVVAGTGGLLSLARFQAVFGSRLELLATTVAIGWLVFLGAFLVVRLARQLVPRASSYELR